MKFWKKKKPAWKLQLGLDVKRCAECGKLDRLCLADGKPATFHRWVRWEEERVLLDYLIKPEGRAEILRAYLETGVLDAAGHIEKVLQIAALVEYPDGSVGRVKPELITFLDRREG